MIIPLSDDFDPDKIAESGQCFRWSKTDDHTCRIIAGQSCLYLKVLGDDCFDLECTEEEFGSFWVHYFDLKENYRCIRERIDPEQDPFLWKAAEQEKGIRILRQDPWEMLVTFIISQNKNIPGICRCVELLSERCGEKKMDSRGRVYHAFPEPSAILALSGNDLKACRLGYRCRYVQAAAKAVMDGAVDLNRLAEADEETTLTALTGILGVGIKVANCVSLFGLHHINAFPVDTWIRRILEQEYPAGYPFEKYSPYNGIYQQYMFAYYRHKPRNGASGRSLQIRR